MSVQTLDQRLASLRDLRRSVDREIRRVEKAIADGIRAEAIRRRGRKPRRSRFDVPACGTETAFQRHHYRREPVDTACREAHAAFERQRSAELRRIVGSLPWGGEAS